MMKRFKGLLIGLGVLVLLAIWAFTSPSLDSHSTSREIAAPQAQVWAVISDVGHYNKYATSLTDVQILSGSGEGMVRSCSDENGTWTEKCTLWQEGEAYAFQVNTDKFPFPFEVFNGAWSLEKLSNTKTKLTVKFDYQFSYRWMSWFFGSDTHKLVEEGNNELIDNWEKAILGNASASH